MSPVPPQALIVGDESCLEAVRRFRDNTFDRLFVVQSLRLRGMLGVVMKADPAKVLKSLQSKTPVSEIKWTEGPVVLNTSTVREVLKMYTAKDRGDLSVVPVINSNLKLVGVLYEDELIKKLAAPE